MQSEMIEPVSKLGRLGACLPAIQWASLQKSPQDAWDSCVNPSQMIWLVARLGGNQHSSSRRKVVAILCQIIRQTLHLYDHLIQPQVERVLAFVEQWASGDSTVTLGDLRTLDSQPYCPIIAALAGAALEAEPKMAADFASDVVSDVAVHGLYSSALSVDIWRQRNLDSCGIIRAFYPKVPSLDGVK